MFQSKKVLLGFVILLFASLINVSWGKPAYAEKYEKQLDQIDKQQNQAIQKRRKENKQMLERSRKLRQQLDKRFPKTTPEYYLKKQKNPSKTCDCYDQSIEANTQPDNFHYSAQGRRTQRIKPPCKCKPRNQNNNSSDNSSPSTSSSSSSASQNSSSNSSTSSGFGINY